MDLTIFKPARFSRGLLIALALLLLPGCAWLKEQTASKAPAADPERREIAKSKASPKPAAPIGLDGSATGNDAPATPNAPNLVGTQNVGSGGAGNDPSVGLPPSSFETADAGKTAADHSSDDSVVAAGATGGAGTAKRDIVTADGRGEDDLAGNDRPGNDRIVNAQKASGLAEVEIPRLSQEDEVLTNENSVFEFEGAGIKLKNGQVAATVNGQPIFAEDILKQMPLEMADGLARAEREAPPDEFRKIRQHFIKMNLQPHIERELLLQALKSKIKDDQLKGIQKQIDAAYNTEGLPHALKMAGVATEAELEEALQKRGSSIEVLREQFRNRELGQQYLGSKALPKTGFDRPDVLKYYQEHKEEYAIRAQAKWEQIRFLYSKYDGKEGARKKAEAIIERLENGEEFAAIARECSDGPTASSRGGLREWTTEGTLKDKEIERALYAQPVGEIGPPIETENSIEIVRVIQRKPSGYESFTAVQEDIKMMLKNKLYQKAVVALIKDLREKATIETFVEKL
jgi:parvulin-like peptidyl-prolyl isomerase